MTDKPLSERVVELERTFADVTRERDKWKASWEGADKHRLSLLAKLATAERRATEAANRKAYERCLAMMIQATPLGVDEAPFEAWLSRVFPEFHPAVPPEREGAGTDVDPDVPVAIAAMAEEDVAWDDVRPTSPQAAPEQVVLYANVDGERKHIRLTPADCQRIVETGRRASGRDDA